MTHTIPASRLLKVAVILALIAASTFAAGAQRHRAALSSDLLDFESRRAPGRARVIVRGSQEEIASVAARHGVAIVRWLSDSAVLLATSLQVSQLAADAALEHLSGDVPVAPFMSVSNSSSAADQTRDGTPGVLLGLGAIEGVTGKGVTVAVLDTGIASHTALSKKVIANVSFVAGDSSTSDAHGHGTHIAGIIAGNGSAAKDVTPLYTGGVAPGVRLVNVRVLGKTGVGWTSDVIAGIEWAIANRDRYGIRIINLSLGHPVTEPSITDPLCLAVLKATQAGITVIASAGNSGRASTGAPILGGITSPGNSPHAITVGAVNTKATVIRSDDVVATYSSRGPTRYEFVVKPDIVAPGNKVVSLEPSSSTLVKSYPFLHVAGKGTNAYMHLSGTSMSAAMVSGGAALLMEADPDITAYQLKIALQAGSSFMTDAGLMGGGAGSVNFWSSRRTAANGLTSLVNTTVSGVLSVPSGAVFWDRGNLSRRVYERSGIRLLSLLEAPFAWITDGYLNWGDLNLIDLLNPLATTGSNQILWGDIASWTSQQQILWGDTIYTPEGQQILWGDSSTTEDDQILWGDSTDGDPAPDDSTE